MRLSQMLTLARNFGRVRHSLSFLASVYGHDGVQDAMGGLTEVEMEALVEWTRDARCVAEIGTLFGFTAKRLAVAGTAKVVAVDNFSWNPFGLPADLHESFTRHILECELREGRVELVNADAMSYLAAMTDVDFVFLDGDHSYDAVKAEIELVRRSPGVKWLAGHDYGNSRFGVTAAVDETVGKPDAVVGMCYLKRLKGGS